MKTYHELQLNAAFVWLNFAAIILCLLSSCVTTYQFIQPESLVINDESCISLDPVVEIELDYDVLLGRSNKMYAKRERGNNVSLVVVKIQNSGQRELYIPQDLVFSNYQGEYIQPLDIDYAIVKLVKPMANEVTHDEIGLYKFGPNNFPVIEIEIDPCIWIIGRLVNEFKKFKSFRRFTHNMQKHYLQDRLVRPGQEITGFLVLPVKKNTPLEVSLEPYY